MAALDSDDLGAKGESRFQEICAEAHLTCNKSLRDRTGWDFIVEFPFPSDNTATPLDSRSIPISCHVQVKTLLARNNSIKLRLSSAERLAKEIKPSFVYVFKTPDVLTFSDSFLIHLVDQPLAQILKKLRKEHAAGSRDRINRKMITLSAKRHGLPLSPTGSALRIALEQACGRDVHAYSARKSMQLQQLGFDGRPFRGTLTFPNMRVEEIVDVFLGLKPDVPIAKFVSYQVRFGIALPVHDINELNKVTISISPEPVDQCSITIRNTLSAIPAVLKGYMYLPALPGLPNHLVKARVECEQLSFIISGKGDISLKTASTLIEQQCTAEEWANYHRVLLMLATDGSTVEVVPHRHPGRLSGVVSKAANEIDSEEITYWLGICEQLLELLKRAGGAGIPIRLCHLEKQAAEIRLGAAFLKGIEGQLTFMVENCPEPERLTDSLPMLFFKGVIFGEFLLAYYLVADVLFQKKEDRIACKSTRITFGEIRMLPNRPGECARFANQIHGTTGIELSYWDKEFA